MRATRFAGSVTGRPKKDDLYTCFVGCEVCGRNIPEDGTCHAKPVGRGWALYHAKCCPLPHPHPRIGS